MQQRERRHGVAGVAVVVCGSDGFEQAGFFAGHVCIHEEDGSAIGEVGDMLDLQLKVFDELDLIAGVIGLQLAHQQRSQCIVAAGFIADGEDEEGGCQDWSSIISG